MKELIQGFMIGMGIVGIWLVVSVLITKQLPGCSAVQATNSPPAFRAVEYGEGWNQHVYLIYGGSVLHAAHCRGYHENHVTVTNWVTHYRTNTLTEIPDEVWKRYEELRRK